MKNFNYKYFWNNHWYTYVARGYSEQRLADAAFRDFLSRKPGARAGSTGSPSQAKKSSMVPEPVEVTILACGHQCHKARGGQCITKGCEHARCSTS